MSLLHRSLVNHAPAMVPQRLHHAQLPVQRLPAFQHQRLAWQCCCASDTTTPQPESGLEPQQEIAEQQHQASTSISVPPGPMEPPEEQPKKMSPAAKLSEALTSTSITIIGDDTELNWAVCQALSKKIGWFPVSTSKVLLGLQKASSIDEVIAKDGQEALVEAEAKILRGMRDQLRCCISTIADAAAAEAGTYKDLYGSIIIWLDVQDKRNPKPNSPARALYHSKAEVRAALQESKGGFGDKPLTHDEKVAKATSELIKAMTKLLKQNEDLLARKRLYIEFGCRGDWPELKPEDWNPVLEGFDRKEVA